MRPIEGQVDIVRARNTLNPQSVGIVSICATAEEIILRRERNNRRLARHGWLILLREGGGHIQKSCGQSRSLEKCGWSVHAPAISS